MCFCTWIRIRRPLNRDPGSETLFWTTYICNPRTSLPTVWDDHLYGIETHILLEVQLKQLCLEALMGKEAGPAYSAALEGSADEDDAVDELRPAAVAAPASPAGRMSLSYSASCHKNCLRCVKL